MNTAEPAPPNAYSSKGGKLPLVLAEMAAGCQAVIDSIDTYLEAVRGCRPHETVGVEMMTRAQERKHLGDLLEEATGGFSLSHRDKARIVTAMLDGGYRYNPAVLYEASEDLAAADPDGSSWWLRSYARQLEEKLQ